VKDFFLFAVLGLGSGSVYAILGLGLVLEYRGSGVVNFAHGAIAMFATFQFVDFVDGGMDKWTAAGLTLLLSGIGGVVLYVLVIRPLRNAPVLAKLVSTLGILLALQAGASLIYGEGTTQVPALLPQESIEVFGVNFGRDRLWLLVITIILAAVLWAVYRYTRFGLATQAASESEKGAILLGYSPDAIGAANWALACLLAALAGILIAPITSLSNITFTLLIIPALACALVGRFRSFSITAATGILLGIAQSEITRYQADLPSWFPDQGLKETLPFLVIIVAMVITGKLIPPRGTLAEGRPPFAPSGRIRIVPIVVVVAATFAAIWLLDRTYQSALITSMIFAVVALSLVVVTGFVGQISLAQMTFAGAGALAVSKLGHDAGIAFPIPIVLGALIAVPVGILIGLPALRVRGVNLAVITFGAAVAIDNIVFQNPDVTGGFEGSPVPSPELFGIDLNARAHPARYGTFVLIVVVLLALAVACLRRSRTGRNMLAVRDNERAAAAAGINVAATKLQAFAVSAFIAALAGGLLAYQLGQVSYTRFDPLTSIFVVAIAYIGGIASVAGALVAGVLSAGGVFFVAVNEYVDFGEYQALLYGVMLAFNTVFLPDGITVAVRRQYDWVRERLGHRVSGDREPPPAHEAPDLTERPVGV